MYIEKETLKVLNYLTAIDKYILLGTLNLDKRNNNRIFIRLNRSTKLFEVHEIINGIDLFKGCFSIEYSRQFKYFDKISNTKKETLENIKKNLKNKDFDYLVFEEVYHIFKIKDKIDIWYVYKNECNLIDTIHLNKWGV